MANKSISVKNDIHVVTNVVPEKQLRKAQLRALKIFAKAVACTYGPMGGYTAYSMKDPNANLKAVTSNYTKDGFTVLKHIDVDKPIEALLKDEVRDICTQVIKRVGDGTTSAVILSYYIFAGLLALQEKATLPKRDMIKSFKKIIKEAIDEIVSNGKEPTIENIHDIALTSLDGNEEIAQIITDIYKECGMDVYIDVAISNTTETTYKSYNGMTYDEGFIDPSFINNVANSSCELNDAHIYVFESPIDTPDMIDAVKFIIEKEIMEPERLAYKEVQDGKPVTHRAQPTLIISPHISRDANGYIDQLINQFTDVAPASRFPLCLVTNLDNMNQFLMDIKAMTGAKFIKKYIDPRQVKNDKVSGLAPTIKNIKTFAGEADKVVVDALTTRIIGPKMMYEDDGKTYTEFFNNYIQQLQTTLDKYEETKEELVKIGNLKRRINILKANMVDLYVGGIGVADRDALRDSVEDAVLNCRSAAKEGVGHAANFEGLSAFNKLNTRYSDIRKKDHEDTEISDIDKYHAIIDYGVSTILVRAYADLCSLLYNPVFQGDTQTAAKIIAVGLTNKHCPYNAVTEKFDGRVLTSIQTEPVMLDAIAKIISLLFNNNQFLVPDARFNIYTMDESETDAEEEDTTTENNEVTTNETVSETSKEDSSQPEGITENPPEEETVDQILDDGESASAAENQ